MKKSLLIITLCVLFVLAIFVTAFALQLLSAPSSKQDISVSATTMPTVSVTAEPTPSSTPEPTDCVATFGFVGDILMMKSQIATAKKDDGTYDFTRSFEPMRELFSSVDVMVGNFEGTFGGAEYAYTQNIGDPRPPTPDNPNPSSPFQEFSSPDELAENLKELGFDVLTTANNHSLDRDIGGLYRTIETIKNAGILRTGTFLSQEDRETPLIIDINGIKVGIVCATDSINGYNDRLSSTERDYAVARLYQNPEFFAKDISACREGGAEFIIACVHWGDEYENVQDSTQERTARELIEYGVDAIVGSHPHVVQPIKWIETTRDGEEISVPVIYSLGNFISNMSPDLTHYGLFLSMELTKNAQTQKVSVTELKYLPVYCLRQSLSTGERLHQTLPCYSDISRITAFEELSSKEERNIEKCREHILKVCGTDNAKIID